MATRVKQKERTRNAIVDACERLLDHGVDPTIDDIAEEAGMSRATVYRYFDNPAMIVFHAMSNKATPTTDEVFEPLGPELRVRVAAAERAINDYIFGNAHGVRRFQLGTIQRELDGTATAEDRPVRRLGFIDEAMATALDELPPETARRLRYGLSLAIGGEAMLATIDTCRLDKEEARDITRWVCDALVDRALAEAEQG